MDRDPDATEDARTTVEGLESSLVARRPVALRALLVSTTLLRIGTVAAGAGVGFYFGSAVAGFVGGAQALSEALSAPILARFADRVGRRRFLIAGPLIGGLGALLLALASEPRHFAFARILEGIGAGAFVPTALGMVAAASAHDSKVRAKASSAFEGANLLGYAVGFSLAGLLWYYLHSGSFLILAGFYAAAAVVCAVFVPIVPALPVSPLSSVFKAVTGPGPIRSFLPAWMATFALIGAYGSNGTALLRRGRGAPSPTQLLVHHFDPRLIGAILTLWIVILVVGIFLWIPVLTRIGAAQTMRRAVPGAWILSAGMLALNHTTLAAAPIFLPIVSVGILVLAGFGPAAVTYLSECSEMYAADRSALMSFYTVTLAIGGAFGSIVGAVAGQWLQLDGVVFLGFFLSLFAFFALRKVVGTEKKLISTIDHNEVAPPND